MGSALSRGGGGGAALTPAEEARVARKCRSLFTAWQRCHRANPADGARACANLENSLVACHAGELPRCRAAAEAHQRCYMALMNTGTHRGRRDCEQTEREMRECLRAAGLYPFPSGPAAAGT